MDSIIFSSLLLRMHPVPGWGPLLPSSLPPGLQTGAWPSLESIVAPMPPPLLFMPGFDCQTGLAALMHLRVRIQTPADWSKFLQDSPEPCITSLAGPAVEGTQVPVRIHPEIYAVTVTDQKNKLHRILREDGEGEMLWAGVEGQGP